LDDAGAMALPNVRNFVPSDTVSLLTGHESSATSLQEPHIMRRLMFFGYDVATGLAILCETTTLASTYQTYLSVL
jgi:hypothetical protein